MSKPVVTALALTGVVVAACSGGSSPTGAPQPRASGSTPAYVTARFDVGNKPCAVEGGFGSVWVSIYDDNRVVRIDPATHQVIARIPTGLAPCGIAVGAGSVWVENYGDNSVTRIDPRTDMVATTVKVGSAPYDVTYADGAAWVTNYGDGTVTRIDAHTDKTRTVRVQESPTGVAAASGAVWVSNEADSSVSRIDPHTLRVRSTAFGTAPGWASWGSNELWFSDYSQVDRVDVHTGRLAGHVTVRATADDGDIVGRTLWVTDTSGRLYEFDATSGRRLGSWPTGLGNPFVLVGYAGLLWLVDFKGTAVEGIDPAKLPR